jgi:hypothetical protein
MNFSYNAVWEDTMRLTREHAPLLIAIAGVFVFLPAVAFAIFFKPDQAPPTEDLNRLLQQLADFWAAAAPWFLLQSLFNMVGTAAMLRLVLTRGGTVGGALMFALMLLPFYFLLSLLSSLMVGVGFILLIVPGLYLLGRVMPAAPVMVAENIRNPLTALSRSFELTEGKGWSVFGIIFIVGLVGAILVGVCNSIVGIVLTMAAGRELGTLLTTIFAAVLSCGFAILMVMLYAAIYRALTGNRSVEQVFD